jgi:hypothetical protein
VTDIALPEEVFVLTIISLTLAAIDESRKKKIEEQVNGCIAGILYGACMKEALLSFWHIMVVGVPSISSVHSKLAGIMADFSIRITLSSHRPRASTPTTSV